MTTKKRAAAPVPSDCAEWLEILLRAVYVARLGRGTPTLEEFRAMNRARDALKRRWEQDIAAFLRGEAPGAEAAEAARQTARRRSPAAGRARPRAEAYDAARQAAEDFRRAAQGARRSAAESPRVMPWRITEALRTLGLSDAAGPDEMMAAYRRLARQYHPDINKSPGAEEKMKAVNAAMATLKKHFEEARL
jgi:uncharacterized protein YdaU (DUF1376 family)